MTVRFDGRLSESPLVPVVCRLCASDVLVRKSSWNQTSVQWNAEGSARCLERRTASPTACSKRGIFMSCAALNESIVEAVRDGDLPVVDETVDVAT